MNAYEVWKNSEGMSKNDRIDILYKNQRQTYVNIMGQRSYII